MDRTKDKLIVRTGAVDYSPPPSHSYILSIMDALLRETLVILAIAFRHIEAAVPKPKFVPAQGDKAFRFTEKTLDQAIVQKLARVISGLGAATVLADHGGLWKELAEKR